MYTQIEGPIRAVKAKKDVVTPMEPSVYRLGSCRSAERGDGGHGTLHCGAIGALRGLRLCPRPSLRKPSSETRSYSGMLVNEVIEPLDRHNFFALVVSD
jgi:hypothetical protein